MTTNSAFFPSNNPGGTDGGMAYRGVATNPDLAQFRLGRAGLATVRQELADAPEGSSAAAAVRREGNAPAAGVAVLDDVVVPRTFYVRWGKPLVDRVLAALLLVAAAGPMAIVLLVVRINLGQGVIFRQRRVGLNGATFTILKVRTMRHPDPQRSTANDLPHKYDADPRHTRVGRILRKLSLDEVPQLLNVLRGEMSIVGPRPEMVDIVTRHQLWGHPREQVRPGITGVWQISERRHELLHESMDADLDYLRRVTFRHDLEILWRTGRAVLSRSGR